MDIFNILQEARNPSKINFKNNNVLLDRNRSIVLEAEKKITISTTDSQKKTTDYSADVEEDPDDTNIESDTSETTDYTTDVEEVEPDDTDSDEEEPESTDYTEDVDSDYEESDEQEENNPEDGSESTDYTEGVDDGQTEDGQTDDNYSDQYQNDQSQETISPEQEMENKQNLELLDRTVHLYYSICGTINKLDSITHVDIMANLINIQVKKNFSTLCDYMYKFITDVFLKNTYVKNLYIYNYFIESYKINIEMLNKIKIFE